MADELKKKQNKTFRFSSFAHQQTNRYYGVLLRFIVDFVCIHAHCFAIIFPFSLFTHSLSSKYITVICKMQRNAMHRNAEEALTLCMSKRGYNLLLICKRQHYVNARVHLQPNSYVWQLPYFHCLFFYLAQILLLLLIIIF